MKPNNTWKRGFGLLLAAIMLFSQVPSAAFAEEGREAVVTETAAEQTAAPEAEVVEAAEETAAEESLALATAATEDSGDIIGGGGRDRA